jgi:hypothetical protein
MSSRLMLSTSLPSLSISTSDSRVSISSTWWVLISTLRSPSHHSSISIS